MCGAPKRCPKRGFLVHWLKAVLRIPWHRRWVIALLVIDVAGALYGFKWYEGQLSRLPVYTWPVVADSPLSTLLFGIYLLALALGRRPLGLEALASFSMLKYGCWTVIVLVQHMWSHGVVEFESCHLTLSHLGMALESLLFQLKYRPSPRWVLAVLAWSLFNDWADYGRGLHPTLPDPDAVGWVATLTPAITLMAAIWCSLTPHRRIAQKYLLEPEDPPMGFER
ncbi:MAG TPA: DUF1405 domain-containing protein [Clostridia bacterium]|nr:DUF1405 domain-containing protein [Clostridia bacterium]